MAKMIGLSRPIKMEWLNKTVDLLLDGRDAAQIKIELHDYLSFEIKSATNLRKTRDILMTIWVNTSVEHQLLKHRAIEVYKNGDKVVAHWSLLLVTYPMFSDGCALIGKLASMQDTLTTTWFKNRLYETWGERTTLSYSLNRMLQTLKFMGVVEIVKNGVFRVRKHEIGAEKSVEVLLMAMLLLKTKAYYEILELSSVPSLFPFVYDVTYEWLHNSETFRLYNFGGKVVLTAD